MNQEMSKTLCKADKKKKKEVKKEKSRFICKSCERKASKKKYLCKPVETS